MGQQLWILQGQFRGPLLVSRLACHSVTHRCCLIIACLSCPFRFLRSEELVISHELWRVGWHLMCQEVWKWCHYAMIVAVETFKQNPTSMSYIYKELEHLLMQQIWIWSILTLFTTTANLPPDLGEVLADITVQRVCEWCHYAMVEAVEPFKQ